MSLEEALICQKLAYLANLLQLNFLYGTVDDSKKKSYSLILVAPTVTFNVLRSLGLMLFLFLPKKIKFFSGNEKLEDFHRSSSSV